MGDASKEGSSESGAGDSVTEVAAEESFVRERALAIERGSVLAGRYQIEEIIGKGGSGVVLRAFDRTGQVVVALKVLKPELATDAKWEKRFSRELRLARPIQHPNVCRIFDIGEAGGQRFLTMELARGGSLRDELKRGRSAPRPFVERLADAQAAIAGLAAIHAAGIVHRDFKPDNLLRMADGRLVLSDFGLATDAANEPGVTVLIGTPHYMAPEVLAGEPATTRSDVWALGVVLHEIFFGRRPERRPVSFDGSRKTPLRADSPTERALLVLCEMCLSDTPLERPDNAGAVAELFGRAQSTRRHLREWRPPGYALGLAVAVVAAAIAGVALKKNHRGGQIVPGGSSRPAFVGLEPIGRAADWRKLATVVTEVPAHVHCFSMLDRKTARLVWGTPRRAEDVDLATGRRRPSQLSPETYAIGCPQPSLHRDRLLFTARNGAGAMEIRLSNRADGRDATTVTSGFEPLWLPSDDEFVYNVDSFHAAVFLMATSSSSLLSDPDPAERRPILEKAASSRGSEVAVLLGSSRSEQLVAIYGGGELPLLRTFTVRGGYGIGFDGMSDHLFVSYRPSQSASALTELD
jgi:serine/threonine protein kinase